MKNCIVYLVVIMNFSCDPRMDKYDWTYAEKNGLRPKKLKPKSQGLKFQVLFLMF